MVFVNQIVFNEMFLCREFTRFSNEDFCFRIQQDTTKVVKNYISWIMKNFGNNICLSGGFSKLHS